MGKVIDFAKATNLMTEKDAPEPEILVDAYTASKIQQQLDMCLHQMGEGNARFMATLAALQSAYQLSDEQIAHHIGETYDELANAVCYFNAHWGRILKGDDDDPTDVS